MLTDLTAIKLTSRGHWHSVLPITAALGISQTILSNVFLCFYQAGNERVQGARKQTDESFEFIGRDFYELYSLEIEFFLSFIELD